MKTMFAISLFILSSITSLFVTTKASTGIFKICTHWDTLSGEFVILGQAEYYEYCKTKYAELVKELHDVGKAQLANGKFIEIDHINHDSEDCVIEEDKIKGFGN